VVWDGLVYEVMDMDGNRVDKVLVHAAETTADRTELSDR
jgi:CBS domain containing-hemolysin-like protein